MLHTKYVSLMVSEKKIFLSFFNYKSMGANDPRGIASLDPRGLIGRIYVGDHYTLLPTKYISTGPHGFKDDFFQVLSISSLSVLMTHGAWPVWTPGS